MIKVVAANVVMDVLDRAIQVHGSLGMSDDTPLAGHVALLRMLKVADGPDEVHKMVIARRELNRWAKQARTAPRRRRAPPRRHRPTPAERRRLERSSAQAALGLGRRPRRGARRPCANC